MFLPKLAPDEEITTAAFNRLVDKANSRIKSVVSSSIHASQALGTMMTPERSPEGIFAVLTARGPDKHPHHYEFREVVQDEHGDWVPRDGGYRSERLDDGESVVINPAVELNGITGIEPNTVVRLIPAPRMAADNQGRGGREWYFDSATRIRAFCLLQDLIPTGGGEPDLSVQGYFLDDPTRAPVTFYPPHQSAFGHSEVISLGIGRVAGYYTKGTKGWAQWVDRAIAEEVEDRIVWHGEWQIVTLYASLIAEVRIYDALLLDGETGPAQLWWMDVDDEEQVTGDKNFALVNSTYELKVTNTTGATLVVGERLTVQFDRHDYRWYPMNVVNRDFYGKLETGFVNADGDTSHAVDVKACEWDGGGVVGAVFEVHTPIKANMDTNLFENDVVTYRVMSDGTKVIVNDIWEQPIGTVVWEVMDVLKIRNDRGWWLTDGANGTRNLKRRFMMCIDEGGFAGVGAYGAEDVLNAQGGFRGHGTGADGAANNHPNHDNHGHQMSAVDVVTDMVDNVHNLNRKVYDADGANWTTGFNKLPAGGAGAGDDFDGHQGPFNQAGRKVGDTDNRPYYGVYAARQYTGVAP